MKKSEIVLKKIVAKSKLQKELKIADDASKNKICDLCNKKTDAVFQIQDTKTKLCYNTCPSCTARKTSFCMSKSISAEYILVEGGK